MMCLWLHLILHFLIESFKIDAYGRGYLAPTVKIQSGQSLLGHLYLYNECIGV